MPQPLKKPTKLKYGAAALEERPGLTALIVSIVNQWTSVEFGISAILGMTANVLPPVSFALYFSTASLPLRLELVKATARTTLPDEVASQVESLADKVRRRSGERNKIIHAEWAVSDEHADALIRVEPRIHYPAWYQTAKPMLAEQLPPKERLGEIFGIALRDTIEGLEVWKARDFSAIGDRLTELEVEIKKVSDAIGPTRLKAAK